jgi:hypothetical protein
MCGTPIPAEPLDGLAAVDEQRQEAEAVTIGQVASAAYDLWAASIPDSAGPAAPIAQPKNITRFDAAVFRWTGGDNWTDDPTVTVQRFTGGQWRFYANQSGEVQTILDTPQNVVAALAGRLSGKQRWTWEASFEAFDAYPRADVPGGQVPNGTYRFVVDGFIHQGGGAKAYHLMSNAFTVSPWLGVTASHLMQVGDTITFTTPAVVYPRTYKSPIALVHDDLGGNGVTTDGNASIICKTCTFRPWATSSHVVSAIVTVLSPDGSVATRVPATFDGTEWVANVALERGQTVEIAPGGLRDAFGETNGAAIT